MSPTRTSPPRPSVRTRAAAPPRFGAASTDDDYDWYGLASALASFSGLAERLLPLHVPDRTGHCRACRRQADGVAEKDPCKLRALAELAIVIEAKR